MSASRYPDMPGYEADLRAQWEDVAKTLTMVEHLNQVENDPFDTELRNLATLHAQKRADYTGGAHPLANFKAAGEAIGVSTQDAMMLRLAEKFYRMVALRGKEPQCEDLDETDRDMAIICVLRILNRKAGSGYDG